MNTTARGRRRKIVRTTIAALVLGGGLSLGVVSVTAPDAVTQAYGQAQRIVGRWRIDVAKEVPTARLGASGGAQLNYCDGTFTEMESYRTGDVPPVWAAHNNCGGDVVLPLRVGDDVDIVHRGSRTRYTVVDIRLTPKVWVTTKALVGIRGELALQSCFYGGTDVPMKFVGLQKADAAGDPAP